MRQIEKIRSIRLQYEITFSKIQILLDIARDILTNIYLNVFDSGMSLEFPTFKRERFIILKLLAKAEKERQEQLMMQPIR